MYGIKFRWAVGPTKEQCDSIMSQNMVFHSEREARIVAMSLAGRYHGLDYVKVVCVPASGPPIDVATVSAASVAA